MFQIVFPMSLAITLLYWKFFYSYGSMHLNDINSYVHPVFLYLIPALMLLVEFSLNSIIFEYKKIVHLLILYVIYLPMTYLGKFSLGYYPYYFITWNTFYSYAVLFALGLIQTLAFFGVAFVSNYFKKAYIEKRMEQ